MALEQPLARRPTVGVGAATTASATGIQRSPRDVAATRRAIFTPIAAVSAVTRSIDPAGIDIRTASAATALAAADRIAVVMQDHAVARDHDAVPTVPARATPAAVKVSRPASSATAATSARRPFNIVIGRVRRREIQGGITIPAIAAVTAIGRPACAARPRFADDQGARSGMMGESKRDQSQAKTELQRHTARLVDSIRYRVRMSQRQARIRVHRWFILGVDSRAASRVRLHLEHRGRSRQNRDLDLAGTWNTGVAGRAFE
ncbi:hypothetical protein N7638_25940 [Achromobacter mucicolens]|uniref:hypothetical protein n=1 Tax=Achromobacter mucicolens TaxID=1389922 RepID=UPI00244A5CBD|nr:hypothetical protein [Achromobacter mucicolens]MDG9971494.1 hypothetical protein [Achromobacter mucicolens]